MQQSTFSQGFFLKGATPLELRELKHFNIEEFTLLVRQAAFGKIQVSIFLSFTNSISASSWPCGQLFGIPSKLYATKFLVFTPYLPFHEAGDRGSRNETICKLNTIGPEIIFQLEF